MLYTLTAFAIVQMGIWRMINTAREACSDSEQRRRLQFLRNVTPHVWNTFWAMWFCQYFGLLTVFQAELGNMFGNFIAKVMFMHALCEYCSTCFHSLARLLMPEAACLQ